MMNWSRSVWNGHIEKIIVDKHGIALNSQDFDAIYTVSYQAVSHSRLLEKENVATETQTKEKDPYTRRLARPTVLVSRNDNY